MYLNPIKAAAVSEFRSIKLEEAGRKVITLLDILINEARIDNDTAPADAVLKNQGKIDALMTLLSYLQRPEMTVQQYIDAQPR